MFEPQGRRGGAGGPSEAEMNRLSTTALVERPLPARAGPRG